MEGAGGRDAGGVFVMKAVTIQIQIDREDAGKLTGIDFSTQALNLIATKAEELAEALNHLGYVRFQCYLNEKAYFKTGSPNMIEIAR